MKETLAPTSLDELTEVVRTTPRLLPVGAGTKPRLSALDVPQLSLTQLRGIVEYDPGEFTFTAFAGTPVRDIAAALAKQGQYLPFDPVLLDAGSTLGGTIASGVSGPGRFRFGGIRDFILGVRFVDGGGRLLRLGGQVVKNAAGFDLPKFFVGSLGRFGVLAEVTMKVFPRPAATLTLRISVQNIEGATSILLNAAGRRWELDALDIPPGDLSIVMRLAGPAAALQSIACEILSEWPGRILPDDEAEALWGNLREFAWAHRDGFLAKVALAPAQLSPLHHLLGTLDDVRFHVSAGGNMAFVSLPPAADPRKLSQGLSALALSGVMLRGAGSLWLGVCGETKVAGAVKGAMDPHHRFPTLDD